MLAGKRAVRVGDQLLKEIAELLMRKVRDPRVKDVTLTGIRMSNDLKHATVFFSVLGDEEEVRKVRSGLDRAKGFVKREIGLRLDLKYVPEIAFRYDPSLEMGHHMEEVFAKLKSAESAESDNESH